MTALVSVIFVLDARAAPRRALHSVLVQQQQAEMEVLLVGEGELAAELARLDARVRVVNASGSLAARLNAGLRAARGEIVAFQDSESEWLPLKLENQLQRLNETPGKDWVGGSWIHYRDGRVSSPTPPCMVVDPPPKPCLLRSYAHPLAAWIARREALLTAGGFDEDLPPGMTAWRLGQKFINTGKACFVADNVALLHRDPDDAESLPPETDAPPLAEQPLVTVVIPTHKRPKLLRRAILSVLAQTYRNIELIVVDDCSPDNTGEVVASIRDPRLRYIRQPQNKRAAAARNVGIQQAQGEYLAFQDDDDIWLPQKLEVQMRALLAAPQNVGLVLCAHIKLSTTETLYVGGERNFGWIDFKEGMNWRFGMIATPAWVARKEVLIKAGLFDEGMKAWDDWEYALRIREVCDFSHVPDPFFIQDQRRVVGTGMWDNQKVYANDMGIIMRRHSHYWAQRPEILERHYTMIAVSEFLFHSQAEGRKWYWQAVRARPSSPKAWAYWALSYLPRGFISHGKQGMTALRRGLRRDG